MAAVNLGGVAPDVVLSCQAEGQLVVLPVVPAHIDGEAVGALKAHGGQLALLHLFPPGVRPQIPPGLQLLADFLQFRLGVRPVQLLQHAFQILQLLPAQAQLMGQLLFRVFHPGVILVEFGGVLLGGQDGRQGDGNEPHVLVVKVLAFNALLTLDHTAQVGGEDVPQLAQPLPVIGGFQLLLL